MKVLLLGATGFIGQAILCELLKSDCHEVVALVRSADAAKKVGDLGAASLCGCIDYPNSWIEEIQNFDAVIHVAATFLDDMGDVDRKLVETLIKVSQNRKNPIRVIYTGGCWLYGDTGGQEYDENNEFNSIRAFQWMIDNWTLLTSANNIEPILIHPAMVYDENGGAVSRFIEDAKTKERIEVWGDLDIHWPLVHRKDLAKAYCLALDKAKSKSSYIVAGENGVPVASLVQKISERYSLTKAPLMRNIEEVVAEQGDWAYGPALDQKLSSNKITKELGWSPEYQNALSLLG